MTCIKYELGRPCGSSITARGHCLRHLFPLCHHVIHDELWSWDIEPFVEHLDLLGLSTFELDADTARAIVMTFDDRTDHIDDDSMAGECEWWDVTDADLIQEDYDTGRRT